MIIGSPPCVAFSQLQSLVQDSERKAEQLAEGIQHMQFMAKLYKKQMDAGRLFLHEHPACATSSKQTCILHIMSCSGVRRITNDQCQFEQKTTEGIPVRKPTGWMSNCPVILNQLDVRRRGTHRGVSTSVSDNT